MKLSNYILNTMFAAMLLIPASLTAQNKTFENLAKKENVEYVYIPQSSLWTECSLTALSTCRKP